MSNEDTIEMRARAAGAAVRSAAAVRATPPVAQVTSPSIAGVAASPRRTVAVRVGAGLVAVAVAASVAVAVWVVGNDNDRDPLRPADTSVDARRVIDALPDGFSAVGAFGPGEALETADDQAMWWVTGSDPSQVAAVGQVFGADSDGFPQTWLDTYTTNVTSLDAGGREAYLGDAIEETFAGVRELMLHGDDTWYLVTARGLDDATLVSIAVAAADGLLVADELPAGLRMVGVAPAIWATALREGDAELSAGLCAVAYSRTTTMTFGEGSTSGTATNEDVILLTTTPDTAMSDAQLALYFPVSSTISGTPYSRIEWPGSGDLALLAWQADGVAYWLIGTVSEAELVAAANSVQVPRDDEWDALLAAGVAAAAANGSGSSDSSTEQPVPASTAVAVVETTTAG